MRSSRHHSILAGRIAVLSVLFLALSPPSAAASDETILPDSWVYPALRTLELAGLVELDPSIPYSRSEIRRYVTDAREAVAGRSGALTSRRRFLLDRLEREFLADDPREREDSPVLLLTEGG